MDETIQTLIKALLKRKFTPEFKAEVVLEVLSGATSQAEVCKHRETTSQKVPDNLKTICGKSTLSSGIRRGNTHRLLRSFQIEFNFRDAKQFWGLEVL